MIFRRSNAIAWRPFTIISLLLIASGLRSVTAQTTYRIQGIKLLNNDFVTNYPTSINNRGQVVGYCTNVDGWALLCGNGFRSRAFLYDHGKVVALENSQGNGGGLSGSHAFDINDRGMVVGHVGNPMMLPACLTPFCNGQEVRIGGKAAIQLSHNSCLKINNQGQILGNEEILTPIYKSGELVDLSSLDRPFLYDRNGLTRLPGIEDDWKVTGLNDTGDIVGYTKTYQAFLYRRNTVRLLQSLPGYTNCKPTAINKRGEIVGECTQREKSAAFFYRDGSMIDIGSLGGPDTVATAVNDRGQVVGFSTLSKTEHTTSRNFFSKPETHAILYESGRLVDLNSLLPRDSDWVLEEASGINNRGQIIGHGTLNRRPLAFIMTPVYHYPPDYRGRREQEYR